MTSYLSGTNKRGFLLGSGKPLLMAAGLAALVFTSVSASAATDGALKEVRFYEIEKKEVLVEAYPILKSAIADIVATEKELAGDAGAVTTVLASKLAYPENKKTVLVVRYESALYCGTAGCQTNIYVDSGNGYKEALGSVSDVPVFVSSCKNILSVYLTGEQGLSQWTLKGDTFEIGATYADRKSVPACSQ